MYRLFLWWAHQSREQQSPFAQKGEELKSIRESERNMRALFGGNREPELVVMATPKGSPGPPVGMQLADRWMIGDVGHLPGEYTVIAQVDRVLVAEEEYPTMRLTTEAPPTALELKVLTDSVEGFVTPAKALGIDVTNSDSRIRGPGLWLSPIAIYR